MKFKQLKVGQIFEFDSIKSFPLSGMERGPWIKMSSRKYRKLTNPFSLNRTDRDEHVLFSSKEMECQVGSINVGVIPK